MHSIIDITTTQDQFSNRGIGVYTKEVVTGLLAHSAQNRRQVETLSQPQTQKQTRSSNQTPKHKSNPEKPLTQDKYYLLAFDAPSTLDDAFRKYADLVQIVRIGKLRLSDKFNSIWWRRQYLPAIKKLLAEQQPDLYFCPYFWRGFPVNLDCPSNPSNESNFVNKSNPMSPRKLPTIVMIHDLALPILGRYSEAPIYLDWIRKFQYHRALAKTKNASAIITNSENTKNDFLKYVDYDSEKVHSIHLGLSDKFRSIKPDRKILAKYLPAEVIDSSYILYYGGNQENKNVAGVVRAYAELRKEPMINADSGQNKSEYKMVPPLVLAGGAFAPEKLESGRGAEIAELTQKLGVADSTFYTGFFDRPDLIHIICGAKLAIHLSTYEGFGFAALEPMKCGVPVVASNRSCYPEVLGNGALLVNPEDPNEVANACGKILADEEFAEQLSQKGQKMAESYKWEKTAQKTYEVFSANA